jgi:hypothetical protein
MPETPRRRCLPRAAISKLMRCAGFASLLPAELIYLGEHVAAAPVFLSLVTRVGNVAKKSGSA